MILYEEIGLLLPDVGDERGLSFCWCDMELRTLVMVYVYLSVVTGMLAFIPWVFICGLPRSYTILVFCFGAGFTIG